MNEILIFPPLAIMYLSTNEFQCERNGHKVERGRVAFVTLDLQVCKSAYLQYAFFSIYFLYENVCKELHFLHMPVLTT